MSIAYIHRMQQYNTTLSEIIMFGYNFYHFYRYLNNCCYHYVYYYFNKSFYHSFYHSFQSFFCLSFSHIFFSYHFFFYLSGVLYSFISEAALNTLYRPLHNCPLALYKDEKMILKKIQKIVVKMLKMRINK